MSEEKPNDRKTRFERIAAVCLAFFPMLFAGQCMIIAYSVPAFESMFKDLGAQVPAITNFVFGLRWLWLTFPPAVAITAILNSQKRKARTSAVYSLGCGVFLFLLGQFLTYAAFLPIFELDSVAEGLK